MSYKRRSKIFGEIIFILVLFAVTEITSNCQLSQLSTPSHLKIEPLANDTLATGEFVTLFCADSQDSSNLTLYLDPDVIGNNTLQVLCNQEDTFDSPDSWPKCLVKCLIEAPAAEKGFKVPTEDILKIGEKLTLTCNNSNAEIDDTLQNSVDLICAKNGSVVPVTFAPGVCAVPEPCSADEFPVPAAESDLIFKNTSWPILSYRYAEFSCNDSSQITDEGKIIKILCNEGTFESKDTWPVCRDPVDCTEYVPYPTLESGLEDSESVVKKEGENAIFECKNSPPYLINGIDTYFNLTCGSNGKFPQNISWPQCLDPDDQDMDFNANVTYLDPCQCLGDVKVEVAMKLLDRFCRDSNIPSNIFHYNGEITPPSRKRCGNRSPATPTLENHCFCASVEEQAGTYLL